eukprot:766989-Hanusia_phi.AAC.2
MDGGPGLYEGGLEQRHRVLATLAIDALAGGRFTGDLDVGVGGLGVAERRQVVEDHGEGLRLYRDALSLGPYEVIGLYCAAFGRGVVAHAAAVQDKPVGWLVHLHRQREVHGDLAGLDIADIPVAFGWHVVIGCDDPGLDPPVGWFAPSVKVRLHHSVHCGVLDSARVVGPVLRRLRLSADPRLSYVNGVALLVGLKPLPYHTFRAAADLVEGVDAGPGSDEVLHLAYVAGDAGPVRVPMPHTHPDWVVLSLPEKTSLVSQDEQATLETMSLCRHPGSWSLRPSSFRAGVAVVAVLEVAVGASASLGAVAGQIALGVEGACSAGLVARLVLEEVVGAGHTARTLQVVAWFADALLQGRQTYGADRVGGAELAGGAVPVAHCAAGSTVCGVDPREGPGGLALAPRRRVDAVGPGVFRAQETGVVAQRALEVALTAELALLEEQPFDVSRGHEAVTGVANAAVDKLGGRVGGRGAGRALHAGGGTVVPVVVADWACLAGIADGVEPGEVARAADTVEELSLGVAKGDHPRRAGLAEVGRAGGTDPVVRPSVTLLAQAGPWTGALLVGIDVTGLAGAAGGRAQVRDQVGATGGAGSRPRNGLVGAFRAGLAWSPVRPCVARDAPAILSHGAHGAAVGERGAVEAGGVAVSVLVGVDSALDAAPANSDAVGVAIPAGAVVGDLVLVSVQGTANTEHIRVPVVAVVAAAVDVDLSVVCVDVCPHALDTLVVAVLELEGPYGTGRAASTVGPRVANPAYALGKGSGPCGDGGGGARAGIAVVGKSDAGLVGSDRTRCTGAVDDSVVPDVTLTIQKARRCDLIGCAIHRTLRALPVAREVLVVSNKAGDAPGLGAVEVEPLVAHAVGDGSGALVDRALAVGAGSTGDAPCGVGIVSDGTPDTGAAIVIVSRTAVAAEDGPRRRRGVTGGAGDAGFLAREWHVVVESTGRADRLPGRRAARGAGVAVGGALAAVAACGGGGIVGQGAGVACRQTDRFCVVADTACGTEVASSLVVPKVADAAGAAASGVSVVACRALGTDAVPCRGASAHGGGRGVGSRQATSTEGGTRCGGIVPSSACGTDALAGRVGEVSRQAGQTHGAGGEAGVFARGAGRTVPIPHGVGVVSDGAHVTEGAPKVAGIVAPGTGRAGRASGSTGGAHAATGRYCILPDRADQADRAARGPLVVSCRARNAARAVQGILVVSSGAGRTGLRGAPVVSDVADVTVTNRASSAGRHASRADVKPLGAGIADCLAVGVVRSRRTAQASAAEVVDPDPAVVRGKAGHVLLSTGVHGCGPAVVGTPPVRLHWGSVKVVVAIVGFKERGDGIYHAFH